MRTFVALVSIGVLASCSTQEQPRQSTVDFWTIPKPSGVDLRASQREQGFATYYDRNHDGVVDFELHRFGCCDRDWALVDTHFRGHYDLEIDWGYGLAKKYVNLPVPTGVPISAEEPPDPYKTW